MSRNLTLRNRKYLIRHAESLYNLANRALHNEAFRLGYSGLRSRILNQYNGDAPLTQRGVAEASRSYRFLDELIDRDRHGPSQIYTGDLHRVRQTAILLADKRLPVTPLEGLGQRQWSGHDLPDITEGNLEEKLALIARLDTEPDFTVPGVESLREHFEKTRSAAARIREEGLSRPVIVVTHGFTSRCIAVLVENPKADVEDALALTPLSNCAYYRI